MNKAASITIAIIAPIIAIVVIIITRMIIRFATMENILQPFTVSCSNILLL